jgi:hypothetical protein
MRKMVIVFPGLITPATAVLGAVCRQAGHSTPRSSPDVPVAAGIHLRALPQERQLLLEGVSVHLSQACQLGDGDALHGRRACKATMNQQMPTLQDRIRNGGGARQAWLRHVLTLYSLRNCFRAGRCLRSSTTLMNALRERGHKAKACAMSLPGTCCCRQA